MRVSVVVVTWNARDLVLRCVGSLRGQTAGDGVEIVVVDNASTDGTREAVAALPDVRVVALPRNTGFTGGANAGIAASTGDVVVLVNNDAVAQPGLLAALLEPFTRDGASDLAATTGRVLLAGTFRRLAPDEAPAADARVLTGHDGARWVPDPAGVALVNSTGNEVTVTGNGRDRGWLTPADAAPAPAVVFGLNGGCAAVRRAALDDVGPLWDELFLYYEDTELSWRLRRRGWRVEHVPDAVTVHEHAASSGTASALFQDQNERNRLLVALVHAPWPVVVRAAARTLARALLGPQRRRRARVVLVAARLVPAALGRRRAVDRTARVPRGDVAAMLVPEGAAR